MLRTSVRSGIWMVGMALLTGLLLVLVVTGAMGAEATLTALPFVGRVEPVIVTGTLVPLLQGEAASALFVYAYQEDGSFRQIPSQIDRKMDGTYTSTVGTLGPTDEITFMAADLGLLAPAGSVSATLPIVGIWYQIEVQDGVNPAQKGYAYIVRSNSLTRTTEVYATYDAVNDRISTSAYVLGLSTTQPGFDYLALNGSGVNILDRTKIRLQTLLGTRTEEDLGPTPANLLVNGPVRVIVRGGNVIGYRAIVQTVLSYTLPFGVTGIRVSTDFSAAAIGSTFYNALTPGGFNIDGIPDALAPSPLSPWWQVSGNTGTLIHVAETSQVGGTQTNYYRDDATPDPTDTGDQRSYGEVGTQAVMPNTLLAYSTVLAVLAPNRPNMGQLVTSYLAHPFQITPSAQGERAQYRLYLPIVLRP